MNLLDTLTTYCANQFYGYGNCLQCTHPSGKCSGSCLKCSEEVNFHKTDGRTDYDCQKFMYYYVCRYSWKYCSEIIYALEQIDLSAYPAFNILSIGCGGAPDLMAFEEVRPAWDTTEIFYKGYDMNPYWNPIHRAIEQYTLSTETIDAKFINRDIFDVLRHGKPAVRHYNVIVLEYLLSHFPLPLNNRVYWANILFSQLIEIVLSNRMDDSPFLFIINDIDHYDVRPLFDIVLDKLNDAGYHFSYQKVHFKCRNSDYKDGSEQYYSDQNKFIIPDEIKDDFNCAINCTSAQLIVEVQ